MQSLVFNRVELEVPDDWIDLSMINLVSRPADGYKASIVITCDELVSGDIASFARLQSSELRRAVKSYKIHEEGDARAGDCPGYFVEHSFKSRENVQIRQRQLFVKSGSAAYTMTVSHEAERFEREREALLRVLGTFRLRSRGAP